MKTIQHPRVFWRKVDRLATATILTGIGLIVLDTTVVVIASQGPISLLAMLQNSLDLVRTDVFLINAAQSFFRSKMFLDLGAGATMMAILVALLWAARRMKLFYWLCAAVVLALFVVGCITGSVVETYAKTVLGLLGGAGYDTGPRLLEGQMGGKFDPEIPNVFLTNVLILAGLPLFLLARLWWAWFKGETPSRSG